MAAGANIMAKAGNPFAQAHRALTQHFSNGTRYFVLFRSREIVHKAGLRLLNLEGDPFARSNDLTSVLAALAQRSAWQCEVDGYLEALHESGGLLAEIVRDARRGDGAASNALWDLTAWGSPAATFKKLHARPNEAAQEAPVKLLCERYPDLPAGIRQIMSAANSGVPQAPSDDLLVQMVATALKWWPEEEEVFGERMTSTVDALCLGGVPAGDQRRPSRVVPGRPLLASMAGRRTLAADAKAGAGGDFHGLRNRVR
jgi:hypothetical protein